MTQGVLYSFFYTIWHIIYSLRFMLCIYFVNLQNSRFVDLCNYSFGIYAVNPLLTNEYWFFN